MVASAATGTAGGAYSIPATSAAVNGGLNEVAPATDFFGNPRTLTQANKADIGAVECQGTCTGPVAAPIASVTLTTLTFPSQVTGTTSASQYVTLSNTGNADLTVVTLSGFTGEFRRVTGAQNCPTTATFTVAQASSCRIYVTFTPSATGARTGSLSITATNGTVTGSPVSLTGTGVAATFTASIGPGTLAFGNWAAAATNTASSPKALTVTNTGNSALSGLTFSFGGGTPQPFSRPNGTAGGTCGTTLAVGATCTVNVVFTPTTVASFSRTLTVAGANGLVTTGSPVTLTGTGVATRATVSASPLTITLASGAANFTGTGLATFTNTAAAGGAQVNVSNISVTGGSILTYFFNVGAFAGPDTCTGVALAPGASCTVTVRFTNVGSARGTNRTGTITFTDTGVPVAPSTTGQSATLTGFATL
jgi:hypothetical protein